MKLEEAIVHARKVAERCGVEGYCSMEPDDFYLTREEAEKVVGGKKMTP